MNEVGFPAQDIIFDPNIFPVATGMEEHRKNALDFFNATKWIKENLPFAKELENFKIKHAAFIGCFGGSNDSGLPCK